MSVSVDDSYYLPTGVPYDPVLVMAAIQGATILINAANEISSGTIVNDHVASSTIVASEKIQAASIEAAQIATGTITSTQLHANSVTTDELAADAITSVKIQSGQITTAKLSADAVTADKMSVDSLDAISANLGSVTAGTVTGAILQTSQDPADSRVIIDSAGLRGYDSTLGLVFKIPTDGNAPLFASGQIQSATIIDTTIVSNDFKTSSELPYLELSDTGLAYRETPQGDGYGTDIYGTDVYGAGVDFYLGKSDKPVVSCITSRSYADIGLYDRSSEPSGAATIGDLACVSGELYMCTTANTPGTYKKFMFNEANVVDSDHYVNGSVDLVHLASDVDLQGVFDHGQAITIADGDNQTLAITNNDTTNNPTVVTITQNGNGIGQSIDNNGTQHGLFVNQDADLAATKHAVSIYSDVAQTNSPLAKIENDHGNTTQSALQVKQANASSSANAVDIQCSGSGSHINLSGDPSNSSPSDGDLWFDGSELKIRIGATTYTLDKTAV